MCSMGRLRIVSRVWYWCVVSLWGFLSMMCSCVLFVGGMCGDVKFFWRWGLRVYVCGPGVVFMSSLKVMSVVLFRK